MRDDAVEIDVQCRRCCCCSWFCCVNARRASAVALDGE